MKISYIFLSIGIMGTAITSSINLFSWLILDKVSAVPFSPAWTGDWLPGFSTWLVCIVLGVLFQLLEQKLALS